MPNREKGTYLTPTGQLHTLAAKMSLAWNVECEVGVLPATEGMAMEDLKGQKKVRSMSKVKALSLLAWLLQPVKS